jgi:hypothetical protein
MVRCVECGEPTAAIEIREGLGPTMIELMMEEGRESLDEIPGARRVVNMIVRKVTGFVTKRGSFDMAVVLPAFAAVMGFRCARCVNMLHLQVVDTTARLDPEIARRLDALNEGIRANGKS